MAAGTPRPHEKAKWRRAKAQVSFSPCPERGLAEQTLTAVGPLKMSFAFADTGPLCDTGACPGLINTRCFPDDSDKLEQRELKVKPKTSKGSA